MGKKEPAERKSFFKYLDAEGAIGVLRTKTLRWSSPLRFNDPFDVPRVFASGVQEEEVRLAVNRRWSGLIMDPPSDLSRFSPDVSLILEVAKNLGRADREKLAREVLAEDEFGASAPQVGLKQLREVWGQWVPDFRILCLAEEPDQSTMWAYYADRSRGAVIELSCDCDLDSPLLHARPVSYGVTPEALFSASELADLLFMQDRNEALLWLGTLRKGFDWKHEREWRVVSWKRIHEKNNESGPYSDYSFDARLVLRVFLGSRIEPEVRTKIIEFAKSYPSSQLVQVKEGGRGLEFASVGTS